MIPKRYNSFKEIDTQLKILKLQRAIEKEHLVFSYHKAKQLLNPKKMVFEVAGAIQKKLVSLILNQFY